MRRPCRILPVVLLLLAVLPGVRVLGAPEGLPAYRRRPDLRGSLRSDGSPTVSLLMQTWNGAFRDMYPEFSLDIHASGSLSAPGALLEGKTDVAAMSRPMRETEIAAFRRKFGHEPTDLLVGRDAIAVFLHKDNPIVRESEPAKPGLTLAELDAVYSVSFNRGGSPVAQWGALGLEGGWADRPLRIFSTGKESGTTDSFYALVLRPGGKFGAKVKVQPGPMAVVNAVGSYENAIGYASVQYRTRRTRIVPLARDAAGPFVLPTRANCVSGAYPLVRTLHLYVNRKPGKPLPELLREFLTFVVSAEGQTEAEEAGFLPLDATEAERNRDLIKDPGTG